MRIGVNVPDELLNRVKEISPKVKVSQVCREALEECVMKNNKMMELVGADLTDERLAYLAESDEEPDWESYGLEDAREWVQAVTPEHWEFFIYQYDHLYEKGRDPAGMVPSWSQENGTKGLGTRIQENYEWLVKQNEYLLMVGGKTNPQAEAAMKYVRGWLGYVLEVRRRLEQHRKEEYEKMKAEREELRKALETPDLPEQLI